MNDMQQLTGQVLSTNSTTHATTSLPQQQYKLNVKESDALVRSVGSINITQATKNALCVSPNKTKYRLPIPSFTHYPILLTRELYILSEMLTGDGLEVLFGDGLEVFLWRGTGNVYVALNIHWNRAKFIQGFLSA